MTTPFESPPPPKPGFIELACIIHLVPVFFIVWAGFDILMDKDAMFGWGMFLGLVFLPAWIITVIPGWIAAIAGLISAPRMLPGARKFRKFICYSVFVMNFIGLLLILPR